MTRFVRATYRGAHELFMKTLTLNPGRRFSEWNVYLNEEKKTQKKNKQTRRTLAQLTRDKRAQMTVVGD